MAEAQRTLVENGLRDRVTMRVDGGIRTGHDVVMAALLGGEEFGFGTTAMIALEPPLLEPTAGRVGLATPFARDVKP